MGILKLKILRRLLEEYLQRTHLDRGEKERIESTIALVGFDIGLCLREEQDLGERILEVSG